jgi:Zn2+/Cd2+-exporting ATPase
VIKDQVKESSSALIELLLQQGKDVSMVTGDQAVSADDIGKQLGIDSIYSSCLPEDKAKIINKLVLKQKVAFIGDGINDAPVLMMATLGIAMGGIGSDAAIEASDAVIMNDDPSQIIVAQKISHKTMTIVKQNIVMALSIKFIVLVLGALGFANLWLAIFADVGVSILAVFNAMRIFKK